MGKKSRWNREPCEEEEEVGQGKIPEESKTRRRNRKLDEGREDQITREGKEREETH